jgi:peptide/nickel transport system ATP-binding protein/oligopeptide transport system ATP-binding protein
VSKPIIEVDDLRIVFPISGGGTVPAVDGISLAVNAGETFGIIGESGSGKTTLGRALVCLERPSGGAVRHHGLDPWSLPAKQLRRHRRDFQIIFQDSNAAFNPRRTILQSVMEPLEVSDVPRGQREAVALELLGRVGLDEVMSQRYPHELSGGQKQRANIARALTTNPSLIVCDESVAALDVSIQAEILNLLAKLQREQGLTYVFITHSLSVISHISDRIAVMYLGRWMELGRTEDVLDRSLHPYTQALLSAEPMPHRPGELERKRIMLAGETPGPGNIPSGCRFRNRCAYAQDKCASEVPQWREHRQGHWVACHFAGELPQAKADHANQPSQQALA